MNCPGGVTKKWYPSIYLLEVRALRHQCIGASQLMPYERRSAAICMLRMVATDPQPSDCSLSSRERLVTAPGARAIESTFSLVRQPLHSGAAWGMPSRMPGVFTFARRKPYHRWSALDLPVRGFVLVLTTRTDAGSAAGVTKNMLPCLTLPR